MKPLTGQPLADAYAERYARKLVLLTGKAAKVWAHDLGGGWIELQGENLPPHPDQAKNYPNGWSLIDRKRYGYVRNYLAQGV